jgi:hypothetical protein
METRDREAIDGLFEKLDEVERQAGPRDADADRLIAERLHRQPGAPYYMAQTIVMQDLALKNQQARIDALERAAKAQPAASEGGGFFSREADGPRETTASRSAVPGVGRSGPWGQANAQPGAHSPTPAQEPPSPPAYPQQGFGGRTGGFGGGMGGGGFLAGAAQTAMGVAGGVVLGNALGSMIGGHGGLFGGGSAPGTTEVTENVTNNYYDAPEGDVRDASDATGSDAGDATVQDASYDEPGADGGFDDI